MRPIDRNVLSLSALSGVILIFLTVAFAFAGASDQMLLTVSALVGAYVGSNGVVSRDFLAPTPSSNVPVSVVEAIIAGELPVEAAAVPQRTTWRPNVVALIGIAGLALVLTGFLLWIVDLGIEGWMAWVAVLGAFITGVTGIAKDLVGPEPDPAVPASVVMALIGTLYPKDSGETET